MDYVYTALKVLITIIFLAAFTLSAEPLRLSVHAESAILINADTGKILFEKNAHQLMYPASSMKIATALYALSVKGDKLDDVVTIEHDAVATTTHEAKKRSNYTLPSHWNEPDGTHIGLKKGEQLTMRDLLYGMMLASGNDAANAIAQHVAGTIPKFVNQLNLFIKEMGCQQTTFYNPHGLFHPQQQTTVFDMALLTRHALKNPTFCQIVATTSYTRPKTTKQEASTLVQGNKLLKKGKYNYPKAIGVKTGYLAVAGHNIVAAARQDDRTLIAVLFKTKERNEMFSDAIKVFEAAFNQKKVERILLKKGPQKFTLTLDGAASPIASYLQNEVKLEYYPAEEPEVKCLLYWDELTPPIKKNQRIGELKVISKEGTFMLSAPLFAQEDVKATFNYKISHLFSHLLSSYLVPIFLFAIVFIFGIFYTFKRFFQA